ncbi:MAG: carboxymuconolactone decarboxylase family protein [SAR202 cluster bacterium]|nr:carboxymuconolactone decarboxylase family protein [SAR202 cluster bacterium]|tara:strand:+ start:50 stop:487 length:438 start_codon:yes stop_codon:yes gene_type:complete
MMARQEILNDIEATLGIVPGFMEGMADMILEHTWSFLKDFLMIDTALSAKTKALIGIGSASTLRCDYWVPFLAGLAQLGGASDEEIAEAITVASGVARDSVYLNGIAYDQATFMGELAQVAEHVQSGDEHCQSQRLGSSVISLQI